MNKILNALKEKFKSLKQKLMKSGLFNAAKGKSGRTGKKAKSKPGLFAALKEKINSSRHKVLWRTLLISVPVLLLVVSVTLAWYMNSVELWGMEFNTGSIEFNAYVYDAYGRIGENGIGPVPSTPENETKYSNIRLNSIADADVNKPSSAYIVVESTGSIGIQYRIAFDIKGGIEYLGGYTYDITRVTELVTFDGGNSMDVSECDDVDPDDVKDPLVYIDRNAVSGMIDYGEKGEGQRYDVYRVDFMLDETGVDYAKNSIDIYFNISATQIGGDFDSDEEKGNIHNCSTKEEIDRACVEAYPGDTIKLNASIEYPGDLVFNKPINLETNDFTLKVNGNLIYDYVLGNGLRIDIGGQGKIQVLCAKNGVGGNFQIMTPISEVTLIGSNASAGDIEVERNFVIDATNASGSPGVSFFELRVLDSGNSPKMIQLESNTRATVSFGTTIDSFQTVTGANYIEIVNNGVIGEINLSNMHELDHQANSPQIYILNNKDITESIKLPSWSEPFVKNANGSCDGNTRIIQSYTGSDMNVTGSEKFDNADIEKEVKETLVEQIDKEKNDDSRLRIYYRDDNGQTTSIQSILEDYLKDRRTAVSEVVHLEIVSIGTKAVTSDDIDFMNDVMSSLKRLDMQRANVYDESTGAYHRLPNNAFSGETKYEELILPQNLYEIGDQAFENSAIKNVITIPSGVTAFGSRWFTNGLYVRFADSAPETEDADAVSGLSGVKAIFVDEAYIGTYKREYSSYATWIYPTSVLDDNKEHFVRNIRENVWEITYYIGGADAEIGKNITLDNAILNITSVYDNAYRHTFTGTKVSLADSVENLGAGNFYGNTNITEANLNNLKNLGDDAFYKASRLSKVDFGNAIETIGVNAFYYCSSLSQKVLLPDTMQKIGASAFQNTKITAVNTGGTTSVDGLAFANCAELIYAELPNVKVVGENGTNRAFLSCQKLVSVKMPALTKVTEQYMFGSCISLRELYMAANDDELSLGGYPYDGCDMTKLKLYVPQEHLDFYRSKRPGGIEVAKIYPQGEKMGEQLVNGFDIGNYIVSDNGDDTYTLITSNLDYSDSLEIPETFNEKAITHIFDNAFRNQSFTEVILKIGNNITFIGDSAFYGLSGLIEVEFGDSLQVIGSSAFRNCGNMVQDVVLPASMESIGSEAFRSTGILGINTGGTRSVETRAFADCKSLVYAIMPEVTTVAESGTNYVFSACTSLVSADMPKVAKISGMYMFQSCTALSELYMGSNDASVSLGTYAFNSVNAAQIKLFVPENLVSFYQGRNILNANQVYPRGEKLGDKAVNDFVVGDYVVLKNDSGYTLVTSNLEFAGNVVIPDAYNGQAITEIYANAFRNQTFTDANLVLGNNVKIIGSSAFYGLSGLKSVVMDQVTTIGSEAFYGSGIQALNAPKLTTIGNNAFRRCTALESVSIPKVVTIESTYVFAECTSLKSVYFEDVMSVNTYTFYADKNLEKITINRQINNSGDNMPAVMTIDADAPCKIYVPYHSLSAYPNPWSGKPVVSFDISATYNGDTYILADNSGRYVLISFQPGQTTTALVMPATVSAAEHGNISIYAIGEGAFSTVSDSLKSLTLSSTIAQLDGAALGECTVLENIYVNADHMYFTSVDGVLYSKDAKMLVKYPAGRSESFNMTATDYASTVGIGAGAFANTKLRRIVFPASLMVIDSTAFINSTQLSTVEFTGNTPPTLMGAGIFDTSVEGFRMVIPTADSDVVTAYLCAYNFGEYEPYIDLNGNAAPDATSPRNQVHMSKQPDLNTTYAVLRPKKDEEEGLDGLPEDETASE